MPALSKNEAIDRLSKVLPHLGEEDLAEAYYEVFPQLRSANHRTPPKPADMLAELRDYFQQGLADEEIVSLWHVVFPEAWNARFDDETGEVLYDDEPEPIEFSE